MVEFSTPESLLDLNFAEPVLVLIDRIAVSPEVRARIVDAVEQGYREAGESAVRDRSTRRRGCAAVALLPALRMQDSATFVTKSRNRGCSRSTTHLALVHAARASATPSISI